LFNQINNQNFTPIKHEIPEVISFVTLLLFNYKSIEGIKLLQNDVFKNFNTIKFEDYKFNTILNDLSKSRRLDRLMNFLIRFTGV